MTVYELIQVLTKYEPDDDVMMEDGGDEVMVLCVRDKDGQPVLLSWPNVRRADNDER